MSTIVRFMGTSPLTPAGAVGGDLIWSYEIVSDPEPATGTVIALGLPVGLDVKDPASFPDEPALVGTFLRRDAGAARLYAGRAVTAAGTQHVALVAPAAQAPAELLLVTGEPDAAWTATAFGTDAVPAPALTQVLPAPRPVPAPGPGVASGRSPELFRGTLPYASEVFGVYQPLAGWLGRRLTQNLARSSIRADAGALEGMFSGVSARRNENDLLSEVVHQLSGESLAVLSPVGLVTLFREYFFEFDNFLGVPSGHLWLSPGGTVEVVESSTRRTVTEKTAQQSESSTYKVEEDLTSQTDVADAVKEDNANDTKLGASASAGAKFAGIYHADASASFSNESTTKKSSELTHKHTRTQSSRVSSEIQRNFQTTFRTLTDTTDVTSRRYVVENTTAVLVNYELRRKMRKVGVQVQHVGTRLSWQVFLDQPGTALGLGELVHVVPAPDLSSLKKPDPLPTLVPQDTDFSLPFTLRRYGTTKNDPHQDANYSRSAEAPPGGLTGMHSDDDDDHIVADFEFTAPPPSPGYQLDAIRIVSAKAGGGTAQFLAHFDWAPGSSGRFTLRADFLNFGGGRIIDVALAITWRPPGVDPAKAAHDALVAEYQAAAGDLQRRAYGEAVRTRVDLISSMTRRPAEDLRQEERHTVYGRLVHDLQLFSDPHVDSELIRQIFDVDEMLYFAAPEYWRPHAGRVPPRTEASVGKYPVPPAPQSPGSVTADPLAGETVQSWYSHTHRDNALDPAGTASPEWRVDYLLTESSRPAPFGSSLGWLIQSDGDDRRNEFLNAAWVKAVLPVRPGHELEALDWLAQAKVEGEGGLGQPYPVQPGDPASYQDKTLGEVLQLLAAELQAENTEMGNTLATETVYETGFDPLEGGFRPAEPYQVFDQWVEVLPTDQVVAVAVSYDGKTGQQL